jgi:hypothetical protein
MDRSPFLEFEKARSCSSVKKHLGFPWPKGERQVNKEIPIKDIPQTVLDDVILLLKNYLVAVYIVLPEKQQPHPRPIGSGTFVEIEGTHYILTAAHVWRKAREAKNIGLVLTDHQSSFMVLRDGISAKEVWGGKIQEWGPDIALLKLAPSDVGTIKAHKSFLNLAQQKEALSECLPVIEKGLWAVTGMVGEFTEVQADTETRTVTCHIHGEAFISAVQRTHELNGYDYFDLGAKLELPGVPSSFVGVSGGGLWQINLSMAQSGTISWDGKRYFRGVAFWESKEPDGQGIIRCHGPKSIFEKPWDSWVLPSRMK